MQKVLDLCVEARGAAGKGAHSVQPLAVMCEHWRSSLKSLSVLISRKLMCHGSLCSLASKFAVIVFLSSIALFGSDLPDLKQICTSKLPRDDMCQSHLATDILHPDKRHLGVLGNQKTAAPRKACCWLWCFFPFVLKLKPLPEFWGIQGNYQQDIVFVLFRQESKLLFNKVSASHDMFKRESLQSWRIWWVARYGNVFLTPVDETTSEGKAKKELPLTPFNCSCLWTFWTSWIWNFWVGTNNDDCEPPLIGKLSLQTLQCIQQPMRSAY